MNADYSSLGDGAVFLQLRTMLLEALGAASVTFVQKLYHDELNAGFAEDFEQATMVHRPLANVKALDQSCTPESCDAPASFFGYVLRAIGWKWS